MRVGRDLLAVAVGVCAHRIASRPKSRTLPAVGDLVRVVGSRVNEPLEGEDSEDITPVGTVATVVDVDEYHDLWLCDGNATTYAASDAVDVLVSAAGCDG